MSRPQPSFYGRTGNRAGDLITLLHPPYTAWHLSYVVIGAAIAPEIDYPVLAGTILAFFFGLGIAAHALDELHDRPLGTSLSPRELLLLGVAGLVAAMALAVAGAVIISPLTLAWGVLGVTLALAYSMELIPLVHTDIGFAVSWGSFPVLVGYWAQTETVTMAAIVVAAAAAVFSGAQRSLSTPARHVRRRSPNAEAAIGDEVWDRDTLLDSWETPLRLLAVAHVLLAVGLLTIHLMR